MTGAQRVVAGVDIGGTKIAAGLVTAAGAVLRTATTATPAAAGPDAVLAAATALVRDLDHPVAAVGVGSAGAVDPDTGLVRSATDALPGWAGTDLRGAFRSAFGVPVAVLNDVHAHALGEVWRGAARGLRDVLFLAVGTGVGAAVLVDGRLVRGARAVAGHAGHVPVPAAAGRTCTCGATGHAEAVAGGPALLAAYRAAVPVADGAANLAGVAARAAAGDPVARRVLARGAGAVGEVVAGLANTLDPEAVLIGGGVSGCGPAWWDPLRATVAGHLLPPLAGLAVRPAELAGDAPLLGAARLAWDLLAAAPEPAGPAPEALERVR